MPTIQNRSVIFSSSQPRSSKWWWIGDIRNSRLPPEGRSTATWMMTSRLEHEDQPDQRQHQDLPSEERDDRERRAECQRPRVAHEDLGRVDVEPQEPEQRPDDQRAQEPPIAFGWAGMIQHRDDHERDVRERERAAGEPVEAVGDVYAVRGGDDRNAANVTYSQGSMNTSPTNGTRMPLIWYVLWICHATNTATTVCHMSFWRARIPHQSGR